MLLLLASFLASGFGLGMFGGLIFVYVDSYLGIGAQLPIIFMVTAPAGMLGVWAWVWLAKYYERKYVLAVAIVGMPICVVCASLVDPGNNAALFFGALILVQYFFASATATLIPLLLSDAAYYATTRFGGTHTGLYFSLYSWVTKFNSAFGAGIGLFIIGTFGVSSSEPLTDEKVYILKLALALIPSVCLVISIIFLMLFPITNTRSVQLRNQAMHVNNGEERLDKGPQ